MLNTATKEVPLFATQRITGLSSRLLWACVVAMGLWLIISAAVTEIDYSDSYAAIANAQYFLGISDGYFGQRGPLMALLLVPAEWAANRLDLHPLDIRPHHITLALLHLIYVSYLALVLSKEYKNRRSVLVAFLIAIPTFVFFSYAPFISHDIFPGALFLAMLMLAERFAIRPRVDVWLALVLTGLTVALVKHTYALCWIAVLFARVIPFIAPKRLEISPIPVVLLLVAGAVASGIASWLVYAWALGGWAPQIDVLWRPYIQIISIPAAYADDPSIEYPWWFYLRNYPVGYGILNALLILPAIYVAIRSASRLRQSIGIAWLFVLGAMHLLPFYETRYLAFLMPLSAFLLAPLLRFLWLRRRRWTPVLLVLLAVDLLNASVEAVRIFDPFYSENQFGRFFSPIENRKGPVIITNPISFTPDIYSPLVADRYHRIFNMAPQAIVRLYRLGEDQVRLLTPRKYSVPFPLADPATLGEGTLVFSANTVLIRPADAIPSRPRAFTGEFFQVSASVQRRQYERRGSIFESANVASGPFLLFQVDEETGSGQLFSIGSSLSEQEAGQIKKSRVGDGRFGVWGYDAITVCSIGARGSEICKRY